MSRGGGLCIASIIYRKRLMLASSKLQVENHFFAPSLLLAPHPQSTKTHKHHGQLPLHSRAGVVDDRCCRGDNRLGADHGSDRLEADLRHWQHHQWQRHCLTRVPSPPFVTGASSGWWKQRMVTKMIAMMMNRRRRGRRNGGGATWKTIVLPYSRV